MIIVTGGSGFIGSNYIDYCLENTELSVVNIDKLTYASNQENLLNHEKSKRYCFRQIDIGDKKDIAKIFNEFQPTAIVNFAAESHVDNSIASPREFIDTNIVGTFNLLEVSRDYSKIADFRFIHVSTDEVYGTLKNEEAPFSETNQYKPNSPYSASKAASDHLVRAYNRTFGLNTIITNCSNNYGPYQFPEKLIPLTIKKCLKEEEIPVYGDGKQVRDWLYVEDHCTALNVVLDFGKSGESYNIGGNSELQNIEVVSQICQTLDRIMPRKSGKRYSDLITYVEDRPGHDRRYAIDANKIKNNLGWSPKVKFPEGIKNTIDWYLENSHRLLG